jgi:hypothetical protein
MVLASVEGCGWSIRAPNSAPANHALAMVWEADDLRDGISLGDRQPAPTLEFVRVGERNDFDQRT